MMLRRILALLVLGLGASCGTGDEPADLGSSGLATAFDSTEDTIFARIRGAVPAAAVRHLVEEMRIAPGADETSLFTEIREFDVAPNGRIWVFDEPTKSIFLFAPDGALLSRTGRQGAGPGEFNRNSGMVALGDTGLAILDYGNGRLSILDSTGAFHASWPVSSTFFTSNGLVTDRSGHFYLRRPVTEPREGEILGRMGLVQLQSGGVFADSVVPPDLAVPRDVYVARQKGGTSSRGAKYGAQYQWTWHPGGYFLVGHGGEYSIIVARPGVKPLVIRRDLPAVAVEDRERDEEEKLITFSMRQTEPGWVWNGPALPRTKAPLLGLFAARDGRIWAQVAAPSEELAAEELPVSRDSLMPINHYRTPLVYEVFAEDGTFLGRVDLPSKASLIEADGNSVWAIVRDSDGLPGVTRFRLDRPF